MIIVKMLLAIWTSVFLVLPSCPCQILAMLGIESSHFQIVQYDNPSVCGDSDLSHYNRLIEKDGIELICHCDDDVDKLAEQSQHNDDLIVGCIISYIRIDKNLDSIFHPAISLTSGHSPPAALELTSHLSRQVIGVYLL